MNRSWIAALAMSGALAACAQKPEPAPAPATTPQPSVAQGGGMGEGMGRGMGMGPEGRRRMEEMLLNGITLTSDQRTRLDSLQARHQSEMQGLDPRNNEGDRAKMRQMMQSHMAELRALLTPEQQTVFDRNVEEMRSRRGGRGGGAPPRS